MILFEAKSFTVGDLVVYKPFDGCHKKDVSGIGKVSEVIGDGYYRVMFGDYERKIGWWSNRRYHWTNLYSNN